MDGTAGGLVIIPVWRLFSLPGDEVGLTDEIKGVVKALCELTCLTVVLFQLRYSIKCLKSFAKGIRKDYGCRVCRSRQALS